MRWLAFLALSMLAGCGADRGPDDAAVQARVEQSGPAGAEGWRYIAITRGQPRDATAADASAGDIPRGMTVWPVEVSASRRRGDREQALERSLLFYRKSDGGWIGVDGPGGAVRP